jgi:hypothetical protein
MDYTKYKKRICRYVHHCAICKKDIVAGEEYYDGGYSRRAHVECAKMVTKPAPK